LIINPEAVFATWIFDSGKALKNLTPGVWLATWPSRFWKQRSMS